MNELDLKVLERLDKDDREKITYFIRLLLNQSKYRKLKEEISKRRDEIVRGDSLNHDEIWNKLNV
ncbi:hypothetical protein ACX8XP_08825 [Calditrichota bacterium LG25]